ncbi:MULTISPECIES: pseudouridine synthase [Gammaproteobacteria]|uniref:Pseudouridine synthase n=1 Tax=Vreelandella halophila TaxID=86177 RepID=A0A9X5B5K7_9GAMM|nr:MULTISPECIES: pseudouridine synthase [Gammaproteobacteria]KAA8980746.1 pseudouridine synthase [Halospina sp. K52047b]MYL26593.1 pseudouridine synthase [Halomonas utahensis]MYL73930.1 pseudouridine synthase [Halomonas sp. 22501_18_FS]
MTEPEKRRRRRLDFLIARLTGITRKEAKQLIKAGRIEVEGREIGGLKAQSRIGVEEAIFLDDQQLERESGERYLMLNKPTGVVSATKDDYDPTVLDLLEPELRRGLHPVGRLDKDTTGLLLLTTDGEWSHRITSPRHGFPKTYRVWVADPIDDETLASLEEGIMLRGEDTAAVAHDIERLGRAELRLTLTQGRYHQIKRMMGAVGNRVVRLHRERVGPIDLDPGLEPGDYRDLTEAEINAFLPVDDPPQ